MTIPVRWGSIPGRIYVPDGASAPSPVVVYFHGGGFVVGSLDTHENVCRVLAADSGCAVVSVAYRLAPEWPFPAAVEDAFDSVQYVSKAASTLGLDSDRIAVAGDSAGGNLAAACLQMQGGPHVRFQLLAYPKVDNVGEYASHGEYRKVGIPDELGEFFMSCYLPVPAMRSEPLASPAMSPDLRMMPPGIVISAERDVLRDEAEAYGRALLAQGVNVAVLRAVGLPHGFLSSMSLVPSARAVARVAFTAVGHALRVDD
jgi:acetyl esterase